VFYTFRPKGRFLPEAVFYTFRLKGGSFTYLAQGGTAFLWSTRRFGSPSQGETKLE